MGQGKFDTFNSLGSAQFIKYSAATPEIEGSIWGKESSTLLIL